MNEQIEENGLVEEKNEVIEVKEFKPSWQKALSWLSLALSLIVPVAGIGLAIMCISSANLDEKDEVSIICGISLAIAIVLVYNSIISGTFTI